MSSWDSKWIPYNFGMPFGQSVGPQTLIAVKFKDGTCGVNEYHIWLWEDPNISAVMPLEPDWKMNNGERPDLPNNTAVEYICSNGLMPRAFCSSVIEWDLDPEHPKQVRVLAWRVAPLPKAGTPAPEKPLLEAQVGGDHYKKHGAYQPWEVLRRWMTPEEMRGFMKGQAIVYLARERDKNGIEDIEKAKHYIDALLQFEKEPVK